MTFKLLFTEEAASNLEELDNPSKKKRAKAVKKALGYLETNPKHPSLHTHEYDSLSRQGFRVIKEPLFW